MRLTLACLLVLAAVAVAYAEADPEPQANPHPSFDQTTHVEVPADARTFYTVTLTFSTSTATTTSTRTVTCTTSTGGLSICTASGRRRRGLHLSGNKEGRGLFYNEHEEHNEDGTIFLPSSKSTEPEIVVAETEPVRVARAPIAIPYVVQPGFNAPSGIQPRVLLAFSTLTTTVTTTTVSTSSITAVCQSTTGFQLCNSSGK